MLRPTQVLRHLRTLPLALIVLAALLASSAAQAVGPQPLFQMPVPCGQTWEASTYAQHWPDPDSVDLAERDSDGDNISGGEPVLASADGTVLDIFTRASDGENRIYIDHGDWATFYIHLADPLPPLEVGDSVAQGEMLGRTGNTGIEDATDEDNHIHYTQAPIDGIDNAERIEFNGVPIVTREADPSTWNTWGDADVEKLTSLNCAGNSFMGFTQNAMRYQLLYKPGNGDAKIVRLDADGTGATTTMSESWTKGWTHFMPFTAPGGAQHYFQYKASSGRVRFASIDSGGSGTTELSDTYWAAGWTHFVPLNLGGDPYFLAYDSLEGDANVDEIDAVGAGSDTAYSATWDRGWTQIVPFESGGDQFAFFYKGGTGQAEINRISESGGDIDFDQVWSGQWTKGWTNLVPLNHNGKRYFLGYKAATGTTAFIELDQDGDGAEKLAETTWTKGWTAFTPFTIGGDGHVLVYKAGTGSVKVLELNDEGDGADTIWTGSWALGWA